MNCAADQLCHMSYACVCRIFFTRASLQWMGPILWIWPNSLNHLPARHSLCVLLHWSNKGWRKCDLSSKKSRATICIKIRASVCFQAFAKGTKAFSFEPRRGCQAAQNDNEESSVSEVNVEQWCMEVFLNATHYIKHKSIDLFIQQLHRAINLASQSHQP